MWGLKYTVPWIISVLGNFNHPSCVMCVVEHLLLQASYSLGKTMKVELSVSSNKTVRCTPMVEYIFYMLHIALLGGPHYWVHNRIAFHTTRKSFYVDTYSSPSLLAMSSVHGYQQLMFWQLECSVLCACCWATFRTKVVYLYGTLS